MSKIDRRNALSLISAGIAGAALGIPRPLYAHDSAPLDVVVVGAGLSGLHAALLLQEQGMSVRVLEGRQRIGGRVKTMVDVPGLPEGGGQYIGASYARVVAAMERFNLKGQAPDGGPLSGKPWVYYVNGKWVTREDWPTSSLNPLSGADRKILPHQLLGAMFEQSPLSGKAADSWLKPEYHQWDRMSAPEYLRSKGHNQAAIDLTGLWVHTDSFDRTSALYEMKREHFNSTHKARYLQLFGDRPGTVPAFEIEGGNSMLPEAMAAALAEGTIQRGRVVCGIASHSGGVTVECADGSTHSARFAIVSLPLPLLRNVRFSPALPAILESAAYEMRYGPSIRVFMGIREPYWEKDGLPANMWTQSPLDQLTAMSRGPDGNYTVLHAYINGPESHAFNFLTDKQCFDYVEHFATKMRPSLRGLLTPIAVQACGRDPFGDGDWLYWQPGQIVKYGAHLRTGLPRISFCGEHTAIVERGMEGAMESAERVAIEVLTHA